MRTGPRLRLFTAVAAALFALSLSACRQEAGGEEAKGGGKTIAVSLLTREHEFYRQLEAGLREAAEKRGYRLIVQSGDFDLAKQQSQVDNFLVQQADALILCPVDSRGIAPAVEKANAAGIPVFTADIAAQGAKVVSHVASDNVAGGRLAAEYIAQAIGGSGEVGLIGQPELQSTIDREAGFREGLAKYPGIRLVASLNGGGVRDRALRAADDLFQAHPNVRAVFAINDDSALGALSSAQARGRRDVVIVGYDATPEAQRAIAAGSALRADVAQLPHDIGVRTIEAIASHFEGKAPPAVVTVPVRMVTADSIRAAGGPAGS